jgi:NAD(P)H-hydrate epimerase
MTGAAAMAATSAYRSGVGLVYLALPATLVPALNASLTEVVFRPLPATRAGTLNFSAVKALLAEAPTVQATLIGPGLSRNPATQHAIRHFVAHWPGPLVVDADALTAMTGQDALWLMRTAPTIITPHPGEMARLLGRSVADCENDRIGTAKEAARRFHAVTVYKGAPTVIATPSGEACFNPTGNAGLAVAGTGDTLAGSIVAFLAQRCSPLHAAALACYIGGLAAEIIAEEFGLHGITASDIIVTLPRALKELEAKSNL